MILMLEIDNNISSFLELKIGETEAIAEEPQIAFPKPNRIDNSVENLKIFDIIKVIIKAKRTKDIIQIIN